MKWDQKYRIIDEGEIIESSDEVYHDTNGWDDIPDTPEQRRLIADHNEEIKKRYPNMVEIT